MTFLWTITWRQHVPMSAGLRCISRLDLLLGMVFSCGTAAGSCAACHWHQKAASVLLCRPADCKQDLHHSDAHGLVLQTRQVFLGTRPGAGT